jgi:hypothetical protein
VRREEHSFSLSGHTPDGRLGLHAFRTSPREQRQTPQLSNVAEAGGEPFLAFWDGETLEYRCGRTLIPIHSVSEVTGVQALVALNQQKPLKAGGWVVVFGDRIYCCLESEGFTSRPAVLPWTEIVPGLTGIPWLARQRSAEETLLEVVAVTGDGRLCWASLRLFNDCRVEASCRADVPPRFLTGTILASGLVAGVHRGGVSWYRTGRERLRLVAQTQGEFGDAVACFGIPATNELLVVCREGDVVRVPVPE